MYRFIVLFVLLLHKIGEPSIMNSTKMNSSIPSTKPALIVNTTIQTADATEEEMISLTFVELELACENETPCLCGDAQDLECPIGTHCVVPRDWDKPRRLV